MAIQSLPTIGGAIKQRPLLYSYSAQTDTWGAREGIGGKQVYSDMPGLPPGASKPPSGYVTPTPQDPGGFGQRGMVSELARRPGETYEEYLKRLAQMGYTVPRYGATPQQAAPTPTMAQPTPTAPTPQLTPTPSVSVTPATQQPTYQPAPAQKYQSTYYQANGYKPYGGYQQDTFGDKPFSYAYQRPRLQQSYTGI